MKRNLTVISILTMSSATFAQETAAQSDNGVVYSLRELFIDGGAGFMSLPLICLILGLAFVIERIIYLNSVDINTNQFMSKLEKGLSSSIEDGKNVARNEKGPVASIAYQALLRIGDGQSIELAEKSVIGYGGVEVGKLEKNLSWISLFISIAPMLGFMGTVIGMIAAFRDIQSTGSVQPADMAGNIQVALITTLFGLVVAIILQVFYNYITSKVDSIVNNMENSSITIVDLLVKTKKS